MLAVNQDVREWYSKFVLKAQSVKTYEEIERGDLATLSFQECKVAIDFSRHHLTHVDRPVFKKDNIPLELFIDIHEWIVPLYQQL